MEGQRRSCGRCLLRTARRHVQHLTATGPAGADRCDDCQRPLRQPIVVVDNFGLASLSQALFKRLRVPRALSPCRSLVNNICREQFETWKRPGWQLVRALNTKKETREEYLVSVWEDVKALCSFERVARGTNDSSQGRGNVRASPNGSLGLIIPPLLVIHR